jgi:MFS superfamily sulfate permease-like transporter
MSAEDDLLTCAPAPWHPHAQEYVLLWAAFSAIMQFGLEIGIGAGIVMATLYFAYAYAKASPQCLELHSDSFVL